jgi:hypothetical protein
MLWNSGVFVCAGVVQLALVLGGGNHINGAGACRSTCVDPRLMATAASNAEVCVLVHSVRQLPPGCGAWHICPVLG